VAKPLMPSLLLKIRYDGTVTKSGGDFTVSHHHITVAKRVFRGGPWIKKGGKAVEKQQHAGERGGPAFAEVRRSWRCSRRRCHGRKCNNPNLK